MLVLLHNYQVSSGCWFKVSGEGDIINIFADDARKASKIYGVYLLNSGKLKSYADQNNPCNISVLWPTGEARFNAWYTKQTMHGTHANIEGNIIVVECSFTKKVSIFI